MFIEKMLNLHCRLEYTNIFTILSRWHSLRLRTLTKISPVCRRCWKYRFLCNQVPHTQQTPCPMSIAASCPKLITLHYYSSISIAFIKQAEGVDQKLPCLGNTSTKLNIKCSKKEAGQKWTYRNYGLFPKMSWFNFFTLIPPALKH